MADRSYSDGRANSSLSPPAATGLIGESSFRRRRIPSPEEQARREAWGKEWGKIAHQVAAQRREQRG